MPFDGDAVHIVRHIIHPSHSIEPKPMVIGTNGTTWGGLISPCFITEIEADLEASLLGIVHTMPERAYWRRQLNSRCLGILLLHRVICKHTGVRFLQKVDAIDPCMRLNHMTEGAVTLNTLCTARSCSLLTLFRGGLSCKCGVQWMIGHHLGTAIPFENIFQVMTMCMLPDERLPLSVRHDIMAGEHHMIVFTQQQHAL